MDRQTLIELCEKSTVHESKWGNRDSHSAQKNIGEAWALLRAGCEYEIYEKNHKVYHLKIYSKGFMYFEGGNTEVDFYYIPTEKRINDSIDGDWY